MPLSLIIRAKGLFKQKLDFATLTKYLRGAVHVGGVGPYSSFQYQPEAPDAAGVTAYMLYGAGAALGRGFYLYADKAGTAYTLTSPLPTTVHDLTDMVAVADALSGHLGAKTLEDGEGRQVPKAGLNAWFVESCEKNFAYLKSFVVGGESPAVSGVKFPLHLPETLCRRIATVPKENAEKFFSAYLAEKQAPDYYYMKPSFYQNEETGKPFASYALTSGTPSIIPKTPFLPYPPDPLDGVEPTEWMLVMVSEQLGAIGRMPYADFVAKLADKEKTEFDDKHYLIRGLSLQRMKGMLACDEA